MRERVAPQQLPPPTHRNWIWFSFQVILQNLFTFWLGYRSRGMERLPEAGALLLINHQSFLDPLLVGLPLSRPVSYLARDNLFRVPVVGWILRRTYVMAIRRESAGSESIRESVRRLQHGFYVGIFPEGTRTRDGQLGRLKPGVLVIAKRAGVPIVPVGVAGAFEALPRNALWLRPSPVRVVYGEPLTVEEIELLSTRSNDEFLQVIRERIADSLQQAERWLQEDRARRSSTQSPSA